MHAQDPRVDKYTLGNKIGDASNFFLIKNAFTLSIEYN